MRINNQFMKQVSLFRVFNDLRVFNRKLTPLTQKDSFSLFLELKGVY